VLRPLQPVTLMVNAKAIANTSNVPILRRAALRCLRRSKPIKRLRGRPQSRVVRCVSREALVPDPAPSGSPVSRMSVAVAVPSGISFTCDGVNVQVPAKGRPRQPNEIVSVKPFTEPRLTVIVVCWCVTSVTLGAARESVNCAACPATMVVWDVWDGE